MVSETCGYRAAPIYRWRGPPGLWLPKGTLQKSPRMPPSSGARTARGILGQLPKGCSGLWMKRAKACNISPNHHLRP